MKNDHILKLVDKIIIAKEKKKKKNDYFHIIGLAKWNFFIGLLLLGFSVQHLVLPKTCPVWWMSLCNI